MALTHYGPAESGQPALPSRKVPARPKLRPVEPVWIEHQGQRFLHLRDPMGLSKSAVLVPQHLTPLLALCDGTRDLDTLRSGLAVRTGIQLTPSQICEFVAGLDAALALDSDAFAEASAEALHRYRASESRKPSHADITYPSDQGELKATLDDYGARATGSAEPLPSSATLTGVVSPHIDYERGWQTYAQLWRRCAPALEEIELVIIFGTDHIGGPGTITTTRQSYATPLGVLPTDRGIVDGLANVLGPDRAFAEELHHANEHSIELASVWFHHAVRGREVPTVPVLCGSFQQFIDGQEDLESDETIDAVLTYLKDATAGRRTLVIAAADLAHVGPAFGDPVPVDAVGRAALNARDAESIAAICEGDADAFFELSRAESDAWRICGLPPIYLALRLLGGARGQALGYDQCTADVNGGSLVSIVGAVLYEDA